MLYTTMVILHLLGAAVWVGGHIVLLTMVLPAAIHEHRVEPLARFERGLGRLGLAALVVQLVTGLWLAHKWLGSWEALFESPTPRSHLILSKLVLLVLLVVVVGYRYHKLLPGLRPDRTGLYTMLTVLAAAFAVMLLMMGVGIRLGGFF
jgi:uncharacterized membrane protein